MTQNIFWAKRDASVKHCITLRWADINVMSMWWHLSTVLEIAVLNSWQDLFAFGYFVENFILTRNVYICLTQTCSRVSKLTKIRWACHPPTKWKLGMIWPISKESTARERKYLRFIVIVLASAQIYDLINANDY